MSLNLRTIRIPTLAVSACVAVAALASIHGSATAAPVCEIPENSAYPSDTQTYVELRVTKVSCAYGAKFLKPLWRCRTNNGKSVKGQCKRKVQGFSCTEGKRRYQTLEGKQISYGVRVTCKRGSQRILTAYTQSLNGAT